MTTSIQALERARDALTDAHVLLRETMASSSAYLDAFVHVGRAHTEACMALDAARLAAGIVRTSDSP